MRRSLITGAVALGVVLLAACGPKPAPPPPPPVLVVPPPPPPPRPVPPENAAPDLPVPPQGADGLFASVNRGISPAQTIWNLRAAYNVAALNCRPPEREEITAGYGQFLRKHARGLAAANRKIDAEWRQKYGPGATVQREKYMTNVYNHYAIPPTLIEFCRASLAISRDEKAIKAAELEAFAARSLPAVEVVFDQFFRRYAQYLADRADWDARYGTRATQ